MCLVLSAEAQGLGSTKSSSVPHMDSSWLHSAGFFLCTFPQNRERIASCCQVALQRWQSLFCCSAGADLYSGQIMARCNSYFNANQLFQLINCFLTDQFPVDYSSFATWSPPTLVRWLLSSLQHCLACQRRSTLCNCCGSIL